MEQLSWLWSARSGTTFIDDTSHTLAFTTSSPGLTRPLDNDHTYTASSTLLCAPFATVFRLRSPHWPPTAHHHFKSLYIIDLAATVCATSCATGSTFLPYKSAV